MPTSASSNNPHVRLTRETHEKIRRIAHYENKSQGQIISEMADQWIDRRGIPVVVLLPRQKPRTEWAPPAPPAPTPPGKAVAVEGEKRLAPHTRRKSATPTSARIRSSK